MAEAERKLNPKYEPSEKEVGAWHKTIGDNLKKMREKAGYSQESAARELGVSWQTISRWERAGKTKRLPKTEELYYLAKLYKCKPSDFYKGIEGM